MNLRNYRFRGKASQAQGASAADGVNCPQAVKYGSRSLLMDRDGVAAARGDRKSSVWLQDVDVEALALSGELDDIEQRLEMNDVPRWIASQGLIAGIRTLLRSAEGAACGTHPHMRRARNWWDGNCIEAAYRHLHRAEAEIAKLYDDDRADAVIPEAVARLNSNLPSGDPRREDVADLRRLKRSAKAARLSRAIQIGHEAKDQSYARVRRFRNIINGASLLIAFFLTAFAIVVTIDPVAVPLCSTGQYCPAGTFGPESRWDVWIVALLGSLGGALAAAVSIRNIRGAPTPYNLATSLALLKVPSGALTALGALVLINGHVAPGLSFNLATQQEVLAYALLFGYGQQILTRLIDQRAGELAASVPSKDSEGGEPPPSRLASKT